MYDLVIKNAIIADGSGNTPTHGCVAVSKDKIIAVDPEINNNKAHKVIDANGLLLSPGFIDAHGHSDISRSEEHTSELQSH